MKLNIMTFNVQHMRNYNFKNEDRIDFDTFASYIAGKNPDIIGLNEMRGKGDSPVYEDQVGIVGGKAGYEHTFFAPATLMGGSNPYGNAMMSHYPFTAENIIIPDPTEEEKSIEKGWYETRCVIKSDFSFEGRALTVVATHFGLNPSEARHAVETVCKIADATENPIVLMGDFNLKPDSPMLAPIRERFEDTEPLLGEGDHCTFPSDKPEMKIDYIFTRGVRVVSAHINNDVVSDHCSIQAEIEF